MQDYHNGQGLGSAPCTATFTPALSSPPLPVPCVVLSVFLRASAHVTCLISVAATDGMDCCELCASDEWQAKGCLYWTYTPHYGGSCWFKTSRGGVRTIINATSGMVNMSFPPDAIPHQAQAKPMSIGSIVLLVATCGVLVPYLAIGVAFQHRRGETGKNLLPHRDFWGLMAGLVAEGCRFTFTRTRKTVVTRFFQGYEEL